MSDPSAASSSAAAASSSAAAASADAAAPSSASLADAFAAARDDPSSLAILEGFHALKHALRFGATVTHAVSSDPAALAALAAELAPDVAAALTRIAVPRPAELRALGFPRPPHTGVVAIARRPPFSLRALLDGGADVALSGADVANRGADVALPGADVAIRGADVANRGAGKAKVAAPVVLLEDPRHLGNVGAVVRVAAAAGAAGVVTTGARDPWDPAALRGAAGLHFALPVGRAPGAVGTEDAAGAALGFDPAPRPLVALDPDGDPLGAAPLPAGAVLAFGTERHGLSDELLARADQRLRIPMRPGVSSLNLATAVAAVLYGATAVRDGS